MDDDEYERLRWEDVDRKSAAYEEYKSSLEGQMEWLLRDLAGQTFSLEQAAAGLERALRERRNVVDVRWRSESESKAQNLLLRANDGGLGNFESFEKLWNELERAEPWEKSFRRELRDEWISFQHYFDQDHCAELSAETDSLIRYGGVIAAYAILETYIGSFGTILREQQMLSNRECHVRPKGAGELRQNRKFIGSVLGERVGAGSWQELEVFIEMRHCIAHRSGIVDDRLRPKYQHCFGVGRIADIQHERLVPFDTTVAQFTAVIHRLFNELAEAACRRGKLRLV